MMGVPRGPSFHGRGGTSCRRASLNAALPRAAFGDDNLVLFSARIQVLRLPPPGGLPSCVDAGEHSAQGVSTHDPWVEGSSPTRPPVPICGFVLRGGTAGAHTAHGRAHGGHTGVAAVSRCARGTRAAADSATSRTTSWKTLV